MIFPSRKFRQAVGTQNAARFPAQRFVIASLFVIPGCALLGADPESTTTHSSRFRVRAKTRAPE
jgi:hypothetical protein